MIEVYIVEDGKPVGHIEMQVAGGSVSGDLLNNPLISNDYTIRFAVDRGNAIGVYSRVIYDFPKYGYNSLALLKQALETLDERELELERDFDPNQAEAAVPSDLARRLGGVVREIQAGFSRLHRN